MAGEPDIVLVTAPALRYRNDVVEFDLIVLQMLVAMLACVVVPADHANFCLEWNVSSGPAQLLCFRETLCGEDHGTYVSKNGALHLCNCGRDRPGVVVRPKLLDSS